MKGRRRRGLLAALLLVLLCWVLPNAATARPDGGPLDRGIVEVQPDIPDSSPLQYPLTGSGDVTVDPANTGQQSSPGFWANLWTQIKGGAGDAWAWTKNAAGVAWDWTKDAAGVAWDWIKQVAGTTWHWMQGVGNGIGNWWDGLPDWAQGAIKGFGVALGVIAVVVVAIIALPAEIVAAIVAAVGGIVVLIGAGIGALAGGTIYGAKVGGANFNFGYALLATVGGGILGGLLLSPGVLALGSRVLGFAGRSWAVVAKSWALGGGWSGFLRAGVKGVPWALVGQVIQDVFINHRLSSWQDYLITAGATIISGGILKFGQDAIIRGLGAPGLRALGRFEVARTGTGPVIALNRVYTGLIRAWLFAVKGLRGKQLQKAVFRATKVINTPAKATQFWIRSIPKLVKTVKSRLRWLRTIVSVSAGWAFGKKPSETNTSSSKEKSTVGE